MARIIDEIRPRFAFVENSPAITSRGLGVVLGDLAEMGYNARWGVLGAVDAGAPHKRDRIWILAHSTGFRLQRNVARTARGWARIQGGEVSGGVEVWAKRPPKEFDFYRGVADGVPNYMDRLKAIGNGQVPAVAALAWRLLGGPVG
jgi:DNA (cytosine-5)-methyltransferase 1